MQAETRMLGRVDYLPTYEAMQTFTATRSVGVSSENGLQPNQDERK